MVKWGPSWRLGSTPAYDVKGHVAHVRQLWEKYELNTKAKAEAWTYRNLEVICDGKIPHAILIPLKTAVEQLYEYEDIYHYYPPTLEDRTYLESQQHKLSQERIDSAAALIVTFFTELLKNVSAPLYEQQQSTMTVPLHTVTTEFREIVHAIVANFMQAKYGDNHTFDRLSAQITKNIYRVSGIDIEKPGTKKPVFPMQYDGDPLDYLQGTPFVDFFQSPVPFTIKGWERHGIVLSPSGYGKTQLIGALLTLHLKDTNAPGLWVLDPHGDLYATLQQRVSPERLVCIDPDNNPPSFNFLDFSNSTEPQVLQTFSYLMDSLSDGLSTKQGAIVPYLLKLIKQVPDASLETLRLIVDEKIKRPDQSQFAKYVALLPPVDQGFFHTQFYHSSMEPTKQAIAWKIYGAMSSDAFRRMFATSTKSAINFDQLLADRKVVVIKGGRQSLGDDGMRIFLQFIVGQYLSAGLRRDRAPPDKRHLSIMFADEAHTILRSPIIASVCTELRKYNCALWMATQIFEQIGTEVRAAILGSTGSKICGPLSFSDANLLAREMNVTPDFIRSMKAVERSHADWAMYVSGLTDRAVRVRVPYGTLEAMPKQHPPQRTREQIEKQLAAQYVQMAKQAIQDQAQQKPAPDKATSQPANQPAGNTPPLPQTRDAPTKPDEPVHTGPIIKPGKDW